MGWSEIVQDAGGVVPVATLRVAGITRHVVNRAVERNELVRVRRGWLALPDADPMLVAAAKTGVVLTCMTQAHRLGLWVLSDGSTHVAARPHAGHVAVRARVHWEEPAIPRPPGLLADPVENVLAIVARCQPRDTALAVWNSALQSGQTDLAMLRRLPLSRESRSLLDEATPFADSGLETMVVPRLRWLKLSLRRQIWIAGHRVDLLIGDWLVLQIDGGHHVGAQRTQDIEHDAKLLLLGFHVIRVGYVQIVERWSEVQDTIMRAIAQGLHLAH
ncbi:endonuclease domain-containing protein [Microbacterium sp. PMB16]|uniref:endonuclease domain-containing protein n=1 Tax=Microbacterium sp. PMB16 TaxID=3120157 RepID=UPI003F4B8633